MTRAHSARNSLCCVLAFIAAPVCVSAQSRPLTGPQTQAIRDSVIALEHATDLAVDRLDCAAAFANIAGDEPVFVSSGHVVRTRAAFLASCGPMVAPRTGAVFATDTVTADVLSSDAAFVVREGVYTVNLKDGTTRKTYLIMTSIWARENGAWKMVHLHESSRALTP